MIMSNSTYNQLTANLELLKLTQMKLHLDEIRDFVTTNGLSFTEGLLKLSNYEVDFKEQNASKSMIKAAAFPFVKELKDYGTPLMGNMITTSVLNKSDIYIIFDNLRNILI